MAMVKQVMMVTERLEAGQGMNNGDLEPGNG